MSTPGFDDRSVMPQPGASDAEFVESETLEERLSD
jgi:hypothetical protein